MPLAVSAQVMEVVGADRVGLLLQAIREPLRPEAQRLQAVDLAEMDARAQAVLVARHPPAQVAAVAEPCLSDHQKREAPEPLDKSR